MTLTNELQAKQILERAAEWIGRRVRSGKPVVLTLGTEHRTPPQNRHIHPIVKRIAKASGRRTDEYSLDELRWLLVEQWRHETGRQPRHAYSLDGARVVDVSNRTSAMDKSDAIEFIDWLLAFEVSYS